MEKNYPNLTINNVSNTSLGFITNLFITFAIFAISKQSFSQNSVTFTASTTWTCPAGISSIQVEAWGGGGGAKNSANGAGNVTGGGGGGAYARRNTITVVPGTTYTITVGIGGDASDGGATTATFNGVTITAAGGKTGANSAKNNPAVAGGAGGSIGNSVGDIIHSGGNGGSGFGGSNSGSGGGGGSAAGSNSNGNNGGNATSENSPGAGGNAVINLGGAGGKGGINDFGSNATGNYGGGGGGAGSKGKTGGNGMNGAMIITYLCPAAITITAQAQSSTESCDYSVSLETNGSNTTWSPATDLYINSDLTFPYTTGTVASKVFAKPSATTTYTATNNTSSSCTSSTTYEVKNYSKTFIQNGEWNDPNNWSPYGVPTSENCVTIASGKTATISSGANAMAKTVTITNSAQLILKSNQSLIVTNQIINNSAPQNFDIQNNASLVQINNVANTGQVTYKRNATVKKYDYVYWSSPVIDFNMNGIPASARYAWNPTAPNANGGQGNWYAASGNMATGTGYIFRVPNSTSTTSTPDNLTTTFNGVPFNGTKNITVSRGDDFTGNGTLGTPRTISDDNWNLIGNPYPSAIGVNEFLEANSAIEGFVYVWTHGNSPFSGNYQNPFYQNYTYNYNPNDYIQINKTGSTSGSGEYKIASGQGFFVLMNAGSVPGPASATVTFNNSMRSENFSNNMFYKNANTSNNLTQDNNRIWLDLNSSAGSSRILVGYIQGATNQKDRMFDAFTENKDEQNFYSIIDNANNEMFKIQGKALPFNDDDIVPLGVKIIASGNHSIAISEVDGLFLQNQDIYLKDELLNIYHDLKSAPYTFTATAGVHNDRFKLVYKSATVLSNQTFNENEIQIAKNNNIINIESGNETMDNVKVFDTRGRLIVDRTKINNNTISIDVNTVQDQVLILNITTTEGIKIIRKIL